MCRVMLLASATLAICLSHVSRADEPTPEKVKAALKGKWVSVEQSEGGKTLPKGDWVQLSWEFTGDKVVIEMADFNGRKMSPGTYTLSLDPAKDPARIDLATNNPKIGFIGIYKLDGDKLTVCWCPGRETRPATFETSRKDSFWLITFKRQK